MNKELNERLRAKELEFLGTLFSATVSDVVKISQTINPSDFRTYSKQFEVILDYKVKGEDTNVLTSSDVKVSEFIPYAQYRQIELIATELKTLSTASRLIDFLAKKSEQLTENNIHDIISEVQKAIVSISSLSSKENPEISDIMKEFQKVTEEYKKLPPNSLLGIPTGFKSLDEAIDGIRAPHLWIIGAYTSMGKTFFMLNILLSLIKQNKKVVLYSLEMSKVDIASRLMGMLTEIEGKSILKGETSENIEKMRVFLSGSSLRVINEKRELSQITLSMAEESMSGRADVFFVDYLQQIFDKDSDSEYDSMRVSATEFQKFAERYNKPIIALSQVSNEAAKTPDSQVMGFKGSGTIAAAADLALEIWYGEEDKNALRAKLEASEPILMRIVIKKNRHGRTGAFKLLFNGKTGIFSEPPHDFAAFFNPPEQKENGDKLWKQ